MKITPIVMLLIVVGVASISRAQDAAQPSMDLQSPRDQPATPEATPANLPDVPELSKLDEAFKQTSLGKEADEFRLRVELRRLQNLAVHDNAVIAAKAAAASARTDLEKRQRLRDYYNIYYDRMRTLTSSAETKAALDKSKIEHLALLNQPRVRPETDAGLPTPTPAPEHKKHKK